MATPPDSPGIEEVVYELEPTRVMSHVLFLYIFLRKKETFLVVYILVHFYPSLTFLKSPKLIIYGWSHVDIFFSFFWKYFIYSCTIYLQVPKPIPVALDDLCRQTKFTRQEIRVMYRGFKTVRFCIFFFSLLLSHTLS